MEITSKIIYVYSIIHVYIIYMNHIYMYYFYKIKPVIPKGNQPWMFPERTDDEAEVPTLWPPDMKNQLPGKDPDAGRHWRQEEKGTTEDEMAEWHHQFNRYEFQQTLGDGGGQGSLACCSLWGHKESDMT